MSPGVGCGKRHHGLQDVWFFLALECARLFGNQHDLRLVSLEPVPLLNTVNLTICYWRRTAFRAINLRIRSPGVLAALPTWQSFIPWHFDTLDLATKGWTTGWKSSSNMFKPNQSKEMILKFWPRPMPRRYLLVGGPGPPLWKIWVRQLGWLETQYMGK